MKGPRPEQATLTRDNDLSKTEETVATIDALVDGLNDQDIDNMGRFFSETFRWMGNDNDGYLTSERWSAEGTHTGPGLYGEPTGKSVQIWGITQHRIVNGRIVAEWMLFNELDLMMQLAAAQNQQ